ncbi:MAG: serine/threonine protein kinase [Tildeniella nuda ZEHNDER 1965/U140]|jgi:serine/threonine protein kinase|nr:serine/threonine protein kinase [Tildeniella nuda ZEHNDER 1965/U140]
MVKFDRGTDRQLVNQILHDRYHIQWLLGRKPGRRTFMAIDIDDQLPVVIKLMLFSPDFTWDDLKLFEREAETLKSLHHPAIPKYLDFFEVETALGKGFALVQSYIEARSLQEWVQAGCTFSEDELKGIAKELLNILAYLHNRQPSVIHRDIKPSNVLLRNRSGNSCGQVYLVDFGSVQTAAHGGTVTVVGTYGYMPPEQFGGRSLPASDLYGVGATLIYLATGQHPADLPQKDLHVEFKQLTTLSQSLTDWIEWLTDPSLVRRPASTKDALQALLKPRQQRNAQLTTQSILLGTRPLYSYISLKATQTTLELKIPSNQIQYIFPGMYNLYMWGCLLPMVMTFVLMVAIQFWVIPFVIACFIGCRIYFSGLSRSTPGHIFLTAISSDNANGNRLRCADVTFHRDSGSVISTLSLIQNSRSVDIFQGKLKGISAGLETMPRYRLNLSFQDASDTIAVTGNRHEIQWLCDELSEWTGLQAQHWEAPSA